MKKIASVIALSSLVAVTAIATISASIAWFRGIATFDNQTGINGGSQGAYFASGTGKSTDPYVIKNKWHVYNLAWLTYIGWFDKADGWGKNNSADEKQPYFRCEAENGLIDMQGMVLPPIGTSAHPFMGNFNGNNNVIHNFSVSNIWGQSDNNITRKPTTVELPLTDIDIVGFFGVVGLLPSNVDTFPTYNNQKNSISNIGLEDFTIQTQASANGNLVGLATGYVNTNISGVGVGGCDVDIAPNTNLLTMPVEQNVNTSYISHYGTIGYCAQKYLGGIEIRTVSAKNPKVEDGSSAGGGNLFGNSIPMKDIYGHLLGVKGDGSEQLNRYTYISKQNAHYYLSTQTEPYSSEVTNTTSNSHTHTISNSSITFSYAGVKETDYSNNEIASYTFENRQNTDNFIYLEGKRTLTFSNGLTEKKYVMTQGKIHDGKGNYLGVSGTNISNVSEASATTWTVNSNQNLTVTISNKTYYLYSSSTGNLALSTKNNQRTVWTIKDNMFYNDNVGYLVFNGSRWTTATSYTDSYKYYILSGNNYLSNYKASITNASEQINATEWTYRGGYLYTIVNNTTYYLYSKEEGSLGLSDTDKTQWTINNNRFYSSTSGYIVYNNTKWTTSTTLSGTINQFAISKDGQYLGLNGGNLTAVDEENAGMFTMDGNYVRSVNNPSFYITASDGTKLPRSNSKLHYSTYENTESGSWYNPTYYRTYYHYYLTLSNNSWTVEETSNRVTGEEGYWGNITYDPDPFVESTVPTLTFTDKSQSYDYTAVTLSSNKTFDYSSFITPTAESNSNVTKDVTIETNATYFPLQYKDNHYKEIGDTNTGYIIGGSYDGSPHGSIRVSQYSMSNLNNSLNDTTFADNKFEILTKNSKSLSDTTKSGYVRITDSVYNTSHPSMNNTMKAISAKTVDELGLVKYDTARGYLSTTLNSSTNIYGLHFMNSLISENNTIYAERAKMGGWEYLPDGTANHYILKTDEDGYPLDINGNKTSDKSKYVYLIDETIKTSGKLELPESSIDFVLTENGYINFFAGSYFTNNNTFFSLNQIFRKTTSSQQTINGVQTTVYDKNEIEKIREIRKIYKNNGYSANAQNPETKYIYVYNGGLYSLPNGGISDNTFEIDKPDYATELLFDMSWVTDIGENIIMNTCYYFEIPVNEGEYALGSVDGKTGAYLMYLDIGASDKSDDITFVHEKITNTTTTHIIPLGVDFVNAVPTQGTIEYQTVKEGDVGTVIIPKNTAGYKVSFNLANKILTCGPPSRPTGEITGTISQSTYNGYGVSMKFNETDITVVEKERSVVIQNIKTKYTFSAESSTLNKEVVISYTNTAGTKVKDDFSYSELTPNIDRQTYETTIKLALTPGSEDVYTKFKYHSMIDDEVDIEYLYTYDSASKKYTYIFTFVSPDGGIDVNVDVSEIITTSDSNRIVVFRGIDDTDPPESDPSEEQTSSSNPSSSESQEPPADPEDKDQTISETGSYKVRTKVKTTYDEEP